MDFMKVDNKHFLTDFRNVVGCEEFVCSRGLHLEREMVSGGNGAQGLVDTATLLPQQRRAAGAAVEKLKTSVDRHTVTGQWWLTSNAPDDLVGGRLVSLPPFSVIAGEPTLRSAMSF